MKSNSPPQSSYSVRSERPSLHRPAPLTLPNDPAAAAAAVIALVNGHDSVDRASAIEAMSLRVTQFQAAGADITLYELESHLLVLKALFLRFSAETAKAGTADQRSKFAKIAISAHGAYLRTVALMAGLQHQTEGRARVVLEADS